MATAEYRRGHATQKGATRDARKSKKGEEVSRCLSEYVECVKYVKCVNYVEYVISPTRINAYSPTRHHPATTQPQTAKQLTLCVAKNA